jgi:hypothetical protein
MAARSEIRLRRRLAADVRRHAGAEAAHLKRRGVVDFREIARRTALYELIALRLEEVVVPVEPRGMERIQGLLDDPSRDTAARTSEVWATALLALDPELARPARLLRAS